MRILALLLTAIAAVITVAVLSRPSAGVAAQPATTERYAPPAGVVALQAQQATPAPDYAATAAVAQAAAEYAVGQTATAQAQAQATQTAQMGATVQAVTLQWADVAVQQTQSAMTTTAQAVQAAQTTGTYSAQSATASATAAIPAMTATRAAQVVQAEREERGWVVGMGLVVALALTAALAANRWVYSRGAVRESTAQAELARANAEAEERLIMARSKAYAIELAATKQATQIQILGRMMVVVVSGKITAARRLADDEEAPRLIEEPPTVPEANRALVEFIKDAQRATSDWSAAYIPSDAAMGCAGSRWAAHVGTLKELGVVTVQGTGRPAEGQHRTKLTGDWDLGRVLSALENGQLTAPHPGPQSPQ